MSNLIGRGKFIQPTTSCSAYLVEPHSDIKSLVSRIVLKMNPTAVHSILERITAEDDECAEDHSLEEEEEEGAAHSLKDVCDFGKPEPSPFSSRRVMYENEEVCHGQRVTLKMQIYILLFF